MNKLAVAVALVVAGSAPSFANGQTAADAANGFAERVYADYAADSDTDVRIAVGVAGAGSTRKLAGATLESLVGVPQHHIEADDGAVSLSGVHFVPFDASKVNYAELGSLVDAFDGVGYPIADGAFRLLDVDVAIAGESRRHRAVEFCWSAQQHCVVYDPTIEFLDAIVDGHRRRKADGWAPRVVYGTASTEAVPPEGCGLASRPYATYRSSTWPTYTIEYYNVFGMTNIRKILGRQELSLRCDANCNIARYANSETSSAQTFGGGTAYSVDCDNAAVSGASGRTAKVKAETKCSHKLAFGARADASVRGVNLGVEIDWNTQGSIDSRGGQLVDTCGFY